MSCKNGQEGDIRIVSVADQDILGLDLAETLEAVCQHHEMRHDGPRVVIELGRRPTPGSDLCIITCGQIDEASCLNDEVPTFFVRRDEFKGVEARLLPLHLTRYVLRRLLPEILGRNAAPITA